MVALRGKKTSAPAAKPKAVEKTVEKALAKGGKTAAGKDEAAETAAAALAQQQKLARRSENDFLGLLRFVTQAALARREAIPQGQTLGAFCSALLTALCGAGKDRHLSPPQILAKLTRAARKRVCGAVFSADEIAYSCRNCQLDATCVTCKDCFMHRCVPAVVVFSSVAYLTSIFVGDLSVTMRVTMSTSSAPRPAARATAATLMYVVPSSILVRDGLCC